jgi:hypothetical protein
MIPPRHKGASDAQDKPRGSVGYSESKGNPTVGGNKETMVSKGRNTLKV